jgi:hypothetical protein
MNGSWIRLPLLYPEERLLAVAKSPQIGMTVFALVRHRAGFKAEAILQAAEGPVALMIFRP